MISIHERVALQVQSLVGFCAFPIVGSGAVFAMRVARAHRIEGLEEARRAYRRALASGRPTIVCANHLTMVDSAFLHHALASLGEYLRDFRRFSWNVPAVEHVAKRPFLRALVYLGKCITIDRTGAPEERKGVLERIKYLASRGEIIMLFPEGARSRTGRIEPEAVTYGVGEILKDLDRPLVVCAYLRGEKQRTYGSIPAFGDRMHVRVELLEPSTTHSGMRASRDLSRQVIAMLKTMEDSLLADTTTMRR